jgi:hypothetical protein
MLKNFSNPDYRTDVIEQINCGVFGGLCVTNFNSQSKLVKNNASKIRCVVFVSLFSINFYIFVKCCPNILLFHYNN